MSLSFAKQIIFEDKHLLIINKLPGQLSQGGNFIGKTESRGNNLIEMGSQYLGKNPYLVHRLDACERCAYNDKDQGRCSCS